MGNFFTSTQIYNNENVKSKEFIDMFCKSMEKEGYILCDSDESERDYILRFADNCKWVTITSESYEQGNQTALSDTGRIAKMLKTSCVNTRVIDSDCAVMEMYGKSGKKANTLIVGDADEYFGDDTLKPSEKAWKPFLAEGMTWEQLCNILSNSKGYTFVEDCLSALAPIIGMDDSNILFSAEDAEEGDKQTVFLGFKKAEAKEKKLTFISAFKLVFGEMLEPMGYKYLKKGKYPYFVKVINNEILHIISYRHISSSTVGHKAMEIQGGAISLYRRKIDLTGEINEWLPDISTYYFKYYYSNDSELSSRLIRYECNMNTNESLTKDMKNAAELVKEYILSVINNVTDIESYVRHAKQFRIYHELCDIDEYENNEVADYYEGYLLVITHDDDDGIKRMEESIARQLTGMSPKRREENEDKIRERASIRRLNYIALRDRLINDKELFKRVEEIVQKNRANNLEMLKEYGIIND